MLREKETLSLPGFLMALVLFLLLVGVPTGFAVHAHQQKLLGLQPSPLVGILCGAAFLFAIVGWRGLYIVNPNEARVMQFFGKYAGTVKTHGLRWSNPFMTRSMVSLRVKSFESAKLKVNDLDGNPIEIAAVIVWRVADTAEAVFNVDNVGNFVHVQAEAALRNMATHYPYDAHDEGQVSLRSHTAIVAEKLKGEVHERLAQAGVEITDARITHLAYAPEIAQAMLQRQQASAIIAARTKIVEGAVGMVEMALARLAANNTVALDEERKAAMVSNLLVVLCGERSVQPIVNTGTLYTG